jgi:hypothetical protein
MRAFKRCVGPALSERTHQRRGNRIAHSRAPHTRLSLARAGEATFKQIIMKFSDAVVVCGLTLFHGRENPLR